jgi:hypothetical protein
MSSLGGGWFKSNNEVVKDLEQQNDDDPAVTVAIKQKILNHDRTKSLAALIMDYHPRIPGTKTIDSLAKEKDEDLLKDYKFTPEEITYLRTHKRFFTKNYAQGGAEESKRDMGIMLIGVLIVGTIAALIWFVLARGENDAEKLCFSFVVLLAGCIVWELRNVIMDKIA